MQKGGSQVQGLSFVLPLHARCAAAMSGLGRGCELPLYFRIFGTWVLSDRSQRELLGGMGGLRVHLDREG